MNPASFRPSKFSDLIGSAAQVGGILQKKIARLNPATDTLKAMFYGPPGVAKSTLVRLIGEALLGFPREIRGRLNSEWLCSVEETSGANVNADLVRAWQSSLGMGSMFAPWRIRIIEEMDAVPGVAQTCLLDFLDKMPPGNVLLGTSNLQLDLLQERFQTRMQAWKITTPDTATITDFLTQRWPKIPTDIAARIAVGSGGNVRAACLDAESHLDLVAA